MTFRRLIRFALLAGALLTSGFLGFALGTASAISVGWIIWITGLPLPPPAASLIALGSLIVWTLGGFVVGGWLLHTRSDEAPP